MRQWLWICELSATRITHRALRTLPEYAVRSIVVHSVVDLSADCLYR